MHGGQEGVIDARSRAAKHGRPLRETHKGEYARRLPPHMNVFRILGAVALFAVTVHAAPTGANRLNYLDGGEPFYPDRHFPRLTTPQWIGEEGVEAVVILSIDDLRRDLGKYETYLRPVITRLQQIDGRAPVSIMCCDFPPYDPQFQTWLAEGLSLE